VSNGDRDRLLFLLDTVAREGHQLLGTAGRLFATRVDATWVANLEHRPEEAERVDAFVARFGRMQDTIGDKLVPELRRRLAETPGAALDNLNRMEKLGLLGSVVDWIEARNLRNRLVHEYMRDPEDFAGALNRAHQLVSLLVQTYDNLNRYTKARFGEAAMDWPPLLQPPPEPESQG
jgi:hypothetical protein